MTGFAVIVESKKALAFDKTVMTEKGDLFWAVEEPGGWVEATSSRADSWDEKPPGMAKVFKTHAEAEEFAKRWTGHPWWCVPNGKYRIIEVKPRMVSVQQGWAKA